MTKTEYESMMDCVLCEVQRLKTDSREIVLVMSRRIYQAIRELERAESLHLLTTQRQSRSILDTAEPYFYGAYCGMRIGVINEPDVYKNMIAPALVGMIYNQAVNRIGDVIVVSEENGNHIYQMTSEHPVQFNDLGLTVSFETGCQPQAYTGGAATTACGTRSTGDQFNSLIGAVEYMGATASTAVTALNDLAVTLGNAKRNAEAFADEYYINLRGKRNDVTIEPDLSLGDTKLLDDFLSSFKRKSVMQMGG